MSTKLTIKEAVGIIPVSESTLRRDLKSGKVSSEKDPQGRRRIDVSELTRVYGQLKHQNEELTQSSEYVRESQMTEVDTPKIIVMLEEQVADLRAQLAQSTKREKTLLELTDRLQKQNEALMLPPAPEKKPGYFSFLRRD